MRIAHCCANCGLDLSRAPAPIDVHYGLPLVVCGACGTAVVRREHPTLVWSRWLKGLIWTAVAAAARVATVALLTVAVQVTSWLVSEGVRETLAAGRLSNVELAAVQSAIWLFASVGAGLAIGFWFAHVRWFIAAAAWLVWLQAAAFIPAAGYILAEFVDRTPTSAAGAGAVFAEARTLLPESAMVLLASALLGAVFVPLGGRAGLGLLKLRRRWAWRRARQNRKNSWMGQLLARA